MFLSIYLVKDRREFSSGNMSLSMLESLLIWVKISIIFITKTFNLLFFKFEKLEIYLESASFVETFE